MRFSGIYRNIAFIVFIFFGLTTSLSASSRYYYQIQIYRLSGKVQEQKTDSFLKNNYIPALHRAGIASVGVFKPIESDTTSGKYIYVWIPFKSLEQFSGIQEVLNKDQEYQKNAVDFLGASVDQIPFIRKESILLRAFQDAPVYFVPSYQNSPAERIYELRSYESATEHLFQQKVKMFNEGGEIQLFKRLEFNAVFYAEVISGSTMPNLMYLTTFKDMSSHDIHWDSFRNHPDWKKLSALPEYKNTVSKAVKILLHPTDYSDI